MVHQTVQTNTQKSRLHSKSRFKSNSPVLSLLFNLFLTPLPTIHSLPFNCDLIRRAHCFTSIPVHHYTAHTSKCSKLIPMDQPCNLKNARKVVMVCVALSVSQSVFGKEKKSIYNLFAYAIVDHGVRMCDVCMLPAPT